MQTMGTNQIFKFIDYLALEKKIFKLFFTIYGYDSHVGHVTRIVLFLRPLEATYEIELESAKWCQRTSRLKLWTDDDGRQSLPIL